MNGWKLTELRLVAKVLSAHKVNVRLSDIPHRKSIAGKRLAAEVKRLVEDTRMLREYQQGG